MEVTPARLTVLQRRLARVEALSNYTDAMKEVPKEFAEFQGQGRRHGTAASVVARELGIVASSAFPLDNITVGRSLELQALGLDMRAVETKTRLSAAEAWRASARTLLRSSRATVAELEHLLAHLRVHLPQLAVLLREPLGGGVKVLDVRLEQVGV